MRNIITIAAFLGIFLNGCTVFDNELAVKDMGFEAKAEVVWNADYMAYTLNLTLLEGQPGKYSLDYLFDSDHSLILKTLDSDDFGSGSAVELKPGNTVSFLLPALRIGKEHCLSLELSLDGTRRTYSLELPDTSQNAVGIRMDTDPKLDFSRVILTNLMGTSVTTYTVTFSIDGEPLDNIKYMSNTFGGSMEIDFARSESYTFELPYIVAGQHLLTVSIKSSLGSQTSGIAFTEPQRKQTSLKLSYNSYTGNIMISSDYNPLGTEFEISVGATVTGQITYRHKQFFGIAKPETVYYSEKAESSISISPGIAAKPIDSGLLKSLMDKVFRNTKNDASNVIGNANNRVLNADINTVDLKFSINSKGDYAGKTNVTITPSYRNEFPITYKYTGTTWKHGAGYMLTIYPTFSINGKAPSAINSL